MLTKLFPEMLLLKKVGKTHALVQNQGTERFNNDLNQNLERAVKRNSDSICKKTLLNIWTTHLLSDSIFIEHLKLEKIKNKNTTLLYFQGATWKKKDSLCIVLDNKKIWSLDKISKVLETLVGPTLLIEDQKNYEIYFPEKSKEKSIIKKKYKLIIN